MLHYFVCVSSHFTRNINYRNTFLSDEHDCLNSPAVGVVPAVPGVVRTVQMPTILSVTPRRYNMYVYTLQYFRMEIPDHCPALLLLVVHTPARGSPHKVPSPSHPPGAMGFACVSIFRKHFRPYDSLGNWKAPDEHNQDESTLYISDPPEGCCTPYTAGINSFLIVCARRQSFTPQKSGGGGGVDTHGGQGSRGIQIGDGNGRGAGFERGALTRNSIGVKNHSSAVRENVYKTTAAAERRIGGGWGDGLR